MMDLLSIKHNTSRILRLAEEEKTGTVSGAARQHRSLQRLVDGQLPTSTRRVYTAALLAVTKP